MTKTRTLQRTWIGGVVIVWGMAGPASAQTPSSAYRYCLMSGSHRDTVGMVLCRFDTLAQCMASRNGFGDTCYINPQYTGRRK